MIGPEEDEDGGEEEWAEKNEIKNIPLGAVHKTLHSREEGCEGRDEGQETGTDISKNNPSSIPFFWRSHSSDEMEGKGGDHARADQGKVKPERIACLRCHEIAEIPDHERHADEEKGLVNGRLRSAGDHENRKDEVDEGCQKSQQGVNGKNDFFHGIVLLSRHVVTFKGRTSFNP
jgi:hypothetical protein